MWIGVGMGIVATDDGAKKVVGLEPRPIDGRIHPTYCPFTKSGCDSTGLDDCINRIDEEVGPKTKPSYYDCPTYKTKSVELEASRN